ncbi:HEAT repeat domain-containing protein [Enterobacter hormaechei]|uniref:HEAT repeat domain-containing protein n=1 Tax=Enterobacter hormaechei TaxID=158836 RepID=UPI0013D2605E|nr:HEAT repeat domain-containing protein [Enterobacter hormaechei]
MADKKVQWTEQTPENIDELKKKAGNKNNYHDRLNAINSLKKFKCRQSIDILWRLMMNDLVYTVKEEAFRALQAFGEKVTLPRKKKGHLIKDINKIVIAVGNTFNGDFEIEEFKRRFQQRHPEAYDVYQFEKKKKFEEWIINTLKSAPKK